MKTRTRIVLLALLFGLRARLMAGEPATPGLSFISVGNSRAAERAIKLTVRPASPGTLLVKKVPFKAVGNWLPFGPKGVYGFDVAVEEEAGRQAWRGDEKIDEDTSHFGSIVLTDERVTK